MFRHLADYKEKKINGVVQVGPHPKLYWAGDEFLTRNQSRMTTVFNYHRLAIKVGQINSYRYASKVVINWQNKLKIFFL